MCSELKIKRVMKSFDNIKMSFYPTHNINEPSLNEKELVQAKKVLFKKNSFPKINRKFVDPSKPGEHKFALFSYIELPDHEMNNFLNDIKPTLSSQQQHKLNELLARKQVIKGVAKIRGSYFTLSEAEQRAEELIKDVDSTNSIFTCLIGTPFPLVTEGFAEEVNEVDLQNQTEHTISQNVREKRRKDQKEMDELKQQQDELMQDINMDPAAKEEENYITNRVKLAALKSEIIAHEKKIEECKNLQNNCIKWLRETKLKHPEYEETYMDKYREARKAANIPENSDGEDIMKFMKDSIE